MTDDEARLKLADDLANLAEALRDPEFGAGKVKPLFDSRKELRLEAVLGDNITLVAIKRWSDEELAEIKQQMEAEDEWAEYIY